MARDMNVEQRLVRWASSVTVGDGTGFPAMSVLHPEWQPPSPGTTPTMKTSASSNVHATHRAIGRLSMRLRNTIVVHYCIKGTLEEQAMRLDCEVVTVHARINQAHRALQAMLAE